MKEICLSFNLGGGGGNGNSECFTFSLMVMVVFERVQMAVGGGWQRRRSGSG